MSLVLSCMPYASIYGGRFDAQSSWHQARFWRVCQGATLGSSILLLSGLRSNGFLRYRRKHIRYVGENIFDSCWEKRVRRHTENVFADTLDTR